MLTRFGRIACSSQIPLHPKLHPRTCQHRARSVVAFAMNGAQDTSPEKLEEFLGCAVLAARTAGDILKKQFYQPKDVHHKGSVDLVTETDRQCEDAINKILMDKFPTQQFIGEETTAKNGGAVDLTNEPTWMVSWWLQHAFAVLLDGGRCHG